jgi:CBS domain-containing protein
MNRRFATVTAEMSMARAIERLVELDTGVLLVVGSDHRLVGVLTEATVLAAVLDSHLGQAPVSLHMTRNFVRVEPQAPLETVLDQFILHRVSSIPVVENQTAIGVIGRRDVLRSLHHLRNPIPQPVCA